MQRKDAVVALHPSYTFSFAPGVVLKVETSDTLKVRFYDGAEATLVRLVSLIPALSPSESQ